MHCYQGSHFILLTIVAFSPPTGAAFIFTSPRDAVEKFVSEDPYVKAGLVTNHKIEEWTIAIGSL